MRKRPLALICLTMLLFIAILLCACKKAGQNGKATVAVYVKHHGNLIPGAKVYVKYSAKEFPGEDLSQYNLSEQCGAAGEARGHTHINNLNYGYYYFYASGYDSTISEKVSGGIALHIKFAERKKEISLDVPVTE